MALLRLTLLMVVLLSSAPWSLAWSKQLSVDGLRIWSAPDHTRLVLDVSTTPSYKLFMLHNPERVVIDIAHARSRLSARQLHQPDAVVRSVRVGKRKSGALRIVLDVAERVGLHSASLKPYRGKPHRLVVDLLRKQVKTAQTIVAKSARNRHSVITIAVDAGHGGEDPGAIGHHGLQEKRVTLAIAKALVKQLNRSPGVRAFLVRRGDYFVPLKRRVWIARQHHSDLMISIHADSVRSRRVKGASVYTLSERGATQDRVAKALAAKENSSDAVAGIIAGQQVDDPMVSSILSDMARTDSLNSSLILAEQIINDIARVAPVKYRRPKRARFVVLGAMEIPSVLVETDYISNPARERLLKSHRHQRRLAKAIAAGSLAFLRRMGRVKSASGADGRGGVAQLLTSQDAINMRTDGRVNSTLLRSNL
ncbi:MAG: N-acetylmuramoyl-L-alanine amidase [Mariprofundales bacterium]|nr:N-acetylmuramoyl-L-alanine amidase [Mariprofundales bacterium]